MIYRGILLCAALALCVPANATVVGIEVTPTNWRLENYTIDESIAIWITGVSCGALHLPAGASQEERDRLWSLVSVGKTTGRVVGVRYEDSNCIIQSFFLKEG